MPPPVTTPPVANPAAGGIQPAGSLFSAGSSTQQQNQTTDNTGNTQQMNVYNPAAQALQGSAATALQGILSTGQLPGNFGISQQAFDAMNNNFRENIAPQYAAQYGAGSPVIGSRWALMNEQLAAQLGQQQWNNALGLFGQAQGLGYNPIGSSQSQTQ